MKTNESHLIFGAGPLGLAVMRELRQHNKPVRMVNRTGRHNGSIPEDIEVISGNAYDTAFTQQVCAGATHVYQCAQPPYDQWVEKFPALQQSILEGATAAGAKLILGENLYMYGDVDGPIREDLPYRATTRKGKTRAEITRAALEAHRGGKLKVVIGRGSDFYGPGVRNSTLGERAIAPILKGKPASLVGKLDVPHTYTYIEDFGKALVILGEREDALGQVWHVPNPPTLTQRELMQIFFEEAGQPPRMSGMGKWMMAFGGLFVKEARESVEMMYEFEKPFIVDHSKYTRAFGNHATPHAKAARETLTWYQDGNISA